MNYQTINFRKEIRSISKFFSLKAKIRKIKWFCNIDKNIPNEFNTDPKRLRQVLMNLISNSMKFTFEGFVKIKARLIYIQNKQAIKISVSDTGLGLNEKDQKNLFQLFNTH